ncbi:hypothetical protein Unana1_07165 [Umbelopsis nana]
MSTNSSGIVGEGDDRYIPGSRRPDGTFRKERKVRPGFTPMEDIARYSNARMEASKPSAYPPGYTPKAKAEPATKAQKKKPAKVEAPAKTETSVEQKPKAASATSDKEKKIKGLQKKLRQIDDLKTKQKSGEQLNADQLDKISKAKSLEDELSQLKI